MSRNLRAVIDDVCFIGKQDDGTLRVCCSSHGKTLCARHYARTHFVEVGPEWDAPPCDAALKEAIRVARWGI